MMYMTIDRESYDVLESIRNCLVSNGPLVHTVRVTRWNVSKDNSYFTLPLDFPKCLIQPDQFFSRITKSSPEIVIELIAYLGIDSNNIDLIVDSSI